MYGDGELEIIFREEWNFIIVNSVFFFCKKILIICIVFGFFFILKYILFVILEKYIDLRVSFVIIIYFILLFNFKVFNIVMCKVLSYLLS